MFNTITRIMNVDGIRYVETIPDTMYRSQRDQIIVVRSRGKGSKGAIKGSRFYAFVLTPEGVYRKMRGAKGTIRYFVLPSDAASEAAIFHKDVWVTWLKTQSLDDLMEMTLVKRQLILDIERARRTLGDLSAKISGATGSKDAAVAGDMPSAVPGIANLPSYLRRSASLVVSRHVH
jgi:hypothetical protein